MTKEQFTLNFKGESGSNYTFDVCTFDTIFPNASGVYVFAKLRFNDQVLEHITPLYIGESSDIGDRIANHEKWPCVEKHGCTHICVMMLSGQRSREKAETDLRHNYDTPCNDQ
jgi:hypothetical protein